MPLGFLGSIVVALGVPVVVAFAYVSVWPGFAGSRAAFIAASVFVALIVGAVALWFAFSPLTNVGITGQAGPGRQSGEAFVRALQMRLFIAVAAGAVAEFALCAVIAQIFGRG